MSATLRHCRGALFVPTVILLTVILCAPLRLARPNTLESRDKRTVVPIRRARIDTNGDAVPDRLGDTLTVSGRVTAGTGQIPVPIPYLAALQDESGGIHLLLPESAEVKRGDSLRVTGILRHKYGQTQLEVLRYDRIDRANEPTTGTDETTAIPTPIPLTVASAATERYEGRLAQVEGEVIATGANSGGKYLILTGTGVSRIKAQSTKSSSRGAGTRQITVFIGNHHLSRFGIDRFEEGDRLSVTGIVGQHDYDAPYKEYYQILPRRRADLKAVGTNTGWLWTALYILAGAGLVLAVIAGALQVAVRQRTQELKEAKENAEEARRDAEQARDEAQAASRLKSVILANLSHEIRTPLTSIIGFAEAIGEDPESAQRFAPMIARSGRRLMETLNSLLDLSKLEAGEAELDREPVDMLRQAQAVVERQQSQAEEAQVDLDLASASPEQLDQDSLIAAADRKGVETILQNLISNAIKYTREGGEVRVRVYQDDGEVAAEVEDTGIGMQADSVDELFEPFRQGSEGDDRNFEGTGLGLAIVRELVDQMEGRVEVETKVGEGSRFTVLLPKREEIKAGTREART